jgi:hypothetical protein
MVPVWKGHRHLDGIARDMVVALYGRGHSGKLRDIASAKHPLYAVIAPRSRVSADLAAPKQVDNHERLAA